MDEPIFEAVPQQNFGKRVGNFARRRALPFLDRQIQARAFSGFDFDAMQPKIV